jgi:RHS repeat-associated protein
MDFADGTSTAMQYDALGRRISSTDRAGRITRYEYDALGRLTATVYPDGTPLDDSDNPRTGTEYDATGRVVVQIDELGNRTEFEYDDAGRQTLVRDALGGVTTTAYDAAGRRLSQTDALGRATQFVYDTLGRQVQTVFADATTTSTTYDALGRVTAETDQTGVMIQFEYDALGRLAAVVDALAQRTEYGYDEAGNLVSQQDAGGHVTRYEYDGLGRRIATELPLGQRSGTTYDAVGNVHTQTDFNGDTINYEYDLNNRLLTRRYPDATSVEFTYTPTGRRETVTDARGVSSYTYDARDRLLSRTDYAGTPDARSISYTYDAAGNRTSLTVPSGTTTYTYDALNRLETVTDPDSGLTRYQYNEVGALVRTELPNGTVETRQYDELNRLLYLQNTGPAGVISSYRYTLDAAGNRTRVEEDSGRAVDYAYDDLYRLLGESIVDATNGDRTIGYTYDASGNRLTRDDSLDGLTSYEYDANDRLLLETLAGDETRYTYDAAGNTLSKTGPTDSVLYRWDYEHRLTGVDTDADGSDDVQYQYNADGIRVASIAGAEETRFLIDANRSYAQVLEEYTPGGIIKVSYVHGLDLISQNRPAGKSFYHVDGLGSTRALTDSSGLVTDTYIYDAFGRTIGQVGSTGNVYLFAGEARDLATGLDYLRARWMSPSVGRFYGMDPFEGSLNNPVTLNKFLYGNVNPVNVIDPSGRIGSLEIADPWKQWLQHQRLKGYGIGQYSYIGVSTAVFWAARDFMARALAIGNHHFVLATVKSPNTLPGITLETEGDVRFVTMGGFKDNGRMELKINQPTDVAAVREYLRRSKWYKSDWDLQPHIMMPPQGDELNFARTLVQLANNYQSHEQNPQNASNSDFRYRLWDQNCATWVNSIFAAAGVPDIVRVMNGSFAGVDGGEGDLIPGKYFM